MMARLSAASLSPTSARSHLIRRVKLLGHGLADRNKICKYTSAFEKDFVFFRNTSFELYDEFLGWDGFFDKPLAIRWNECFFHILSKLDVPVLVVLPKKMFNVQIPNTRLHYDLIETTVLTTKNRSRLLDSRCTNHWMDIRPKRIGWRKLGNAGLYSPMSPPYDEVWFWCFGPQVFRRIHAVSKPRQGSVR